MPINLPSDDIRDKLTQANVTDWPYLGALKSSQIYVSDLPDSPATAVGIFDYDSPGYQHLNGNKVSNAENLQIRVRAKKYNNAFQIANNILMYLLSLGAFTIDDAEYHGIQKNSGPLFLGRDESHRTVFSVNVKAFRTIPVKGD